jgi:hypothetical protein
MSSAGLPGFSSMTPVMTPSVTSITKPSGRVLSAGYLIHFPGKGCPVVPPVRGNAVMGRRFLGTAGFASAPGAYGAGFKGRASAAGPCDAGSGGGWEVHRVYPTVAATTTKDTMLAESLENMGEPPFQPICHSPIHPARGQVVQGTGEGFRRQDRLGPVAPGVCAAPTEESAGAGAAGPDGREVLRKNAATAVRLDR